MESTAIWQAIYDQLEAAKRQIIAEIRGYPPPIPACDVQFNTLMQQRAAITRELGHLETAIMQCASDDDMALRIHDFLDSSEYLDSAAKDEFRQMLRENVGV